MPKNTIIVADVGGTNTRVALCNGETLQPETVRRFRNAEFSDLGAVLTTYLKDHAQVDCSGACVAVAGPVQETSARLTNLDWHIDHAQLTAATGAQNVAILNDLQAQGHAVSQIAADNLRPISKGAPSKSTDSKLVIGVGTGFNIAPVHIISNGQLVTASESGHASLPVHTDDDLRLARFVGAKNGFADIEEALSGRGVENIYAWLSSEAGSDARPTAAEIFAHVENGSDAMAVEAVKTFARLLGIVAGDLALTHLPFGGIYFSGGVTRAYGPYLADFGFTDAFRAKGRFSDLMERFDVSVIEDDFAALSGCARHLTSLMR